MDLAVGRGWYTAPTDVSQAGKQHVTGNREGQPRLTRFNPGMAWWLAGG